MRANRWRDAGLEIAIRSILERRGLRYRVHAPIPMNRRRRSDILFTRARIAVFVDGCFWNGCPEHATLPKANRAFWEEKIARNRRRDTDTNRLLTDDGRLVLRFWEHESPEDVVDRLERAWRQRA